MKTVIAFLSVGALLLATACSNPSTDPVTPGDDVVTPGDPLNPPNVNAATDDLLGAEVVSSTEARADATEVVTSTSNETAPEVAVTEAEGAVAPN